MQVREPITPKKVAAELMRRAIRIGRKNFGQIKIDHALLRRHHNENIQQIRNVLKEGFDIGGIIEHKIPVTIVQTKHYGFCYQPTEKYEQKRYGLYPIKFK